MRKQEILQCMLYVITAIVVLCIFGISYTSGSSMYPTIEDESVLIINKVAKPKLDDIVVIWSQDLKKCLCKRVIGLSGDTITIENGIIKRNGEEVKDSFEKSTEYDVDVTLKEGEMFVLGDNRRNSTDSRVLGAMSVANVKGVCILNTHIKKVPFMLSVIFIVSLIYVVGFSREKKNKMRICKNY